MQVFHKIFTAMMACKNMHVLYPASRVHYSTVLDLLVRCAIFYCNIRPCYEYITTFLPAWEGQQHWDHGINLPTTHGTVCTCVHRQYLVLSSLHKMETVVDIMQQIDSCINYVIC